MKIGLVCPYSLSRGGGVQEIVRDLQAGLKKRGHDVKILTPTPRELDGLDTTDVIFLGSGTSMRTPMNTVSFFSVSVDTEAIEQILEQEKFDVLHFHEPWIPVLSRQILSRSKAVNIATFHGVVPETVMSRTVTRVVTPYSQSILKYIDEFTAVSPAAAEYIGSLTDEPIQIIPNGIDLKRFTWQNRSANAKGPKTILYIGRLERRKGLKYLLQAYKLLEEPDHEVRLIIAGAGPDREKLELLAEDLELKNCEFLGYISDEQKMQLLAEADLFCSPAAYGESFGIVLLEAMARGSAVVAGNNSGYAGVMNGTGQLAIVNPRDDVEFARRLELMLTDDDVCKLFLDWAKQRVKDFDYPKIIDAYEACYQKALASHGR